MFDRKEECISRRNRCGYAHTVHAHLENCRNCIDDPEFSRPLKSHGSLWPLDIERQLARRVSLSFYLSLSIAPSFPFLAASSTPNKKNRNLLLTVITPSRQLKEQLIGLQALSQLADFFRRGRNRRIGGGGVHSRLSPRAVQEINFCSLQPVASFIPTVRPTGERYRTYVVTRSAFHRALLYEPPPSYFLRRATDGRSKSARSVRYLDGVQGTGGWRNWFQRNREALAVNSRI